MEVERGLTLAGLEQDEEYVRAIAQRADGKTDVITTASLVGTDGARNTNR